jgi:hypothetical protein
MKFLVQRITCWILKKEGRKENLKCINAEMQMLEAEYEKQLNDHSEVSFFLFLFLRDLVDYFVLVCS